MPSYGGLIGRNRRDYRFSDHFKLNKNQPQLDFVDIPLNTDIGLYVDPYALTVSGDDWLRECGNLVVNFFDHFLTVIRQNDEPAAMALIANLHEPNDAHLGLSLGRPSGRGWGGKQSRMLYDRLRHSTAVKSGRLRDISDIELLIPGIGSDKISDLTVNVLRGEFAAYTEEQCQLLNIPTERISSGLYWDHEAQKWGSRYADLPIYRNQRLILVPKLAVRMRLIPDHEEFYDRFVLDFLSAEHLNANDSLVTLLKNGKAKVYKKDLKNKYKISKEFLFDFTIKHPEVLDAYKKTLPKKGEPLDDEEIEDHQPRPRPIGSEVLSGLESIPPGKEAANTYHSFIMGALTEVFHPWLTHPTKEQDVDNGAKRIDIAYRNSSVDGFFSRLVNMYRFHCPYVFVECKNYSADPANPELDQLTGRFSRKRGNFGILVCRKVENRDLITKRLQAVVNNTEGAVILLEDTDVKRLLELRREGKNQEISDYLEASLKLILM